MGKLVPGLNGLLYGVTLSGGSNGLGTIFTVNTNGAFTNVAAFADFGFPPAGLIQGDDGNLYGTATSGGANGSGVIYELSGFPPTILVQPVARLNEADGASVTFSVSATPQPVAYQWMRNGMPLGDSNEISGSTTSKVTIDPATWVDVGSYSVIITNGGGSITSAVVALGITQPTVAITSPHASARTTNTLITGTASGKPGKRRSRTCFGPLIILRRERRFWAAQHSVSNGPDRYVVLFPLGFFRERISLSCRASIARTSFRRVSARNFFISRLRRLF